MTQENEEMFDIIGPVERDLHKPVSDALQAMGALATATKDAEQQLTDKDFPLVNLASLLYFAKEANAVLDRARKDFGALVSYLEKNLVPAAFEREGTDMVRVPELKRSFSLQVKTSASILDKEAGYEWLRDNGLESLITETVNAGTLAAAMRTLLNDQGIEPPEELIKVTSYNSTGINKYTPK